MNIYKRLYPNRKPITQMTRKELESENEQLRKETIKQNIKTVLMTVFYFAAIYIPFAVIMRLIR